MAQAATKEAAHDLIERIPAERLPETVEFLVRIAAPARRSLEEIPWEDEEISDEENEAAARAKANTGPTISMAEMLADLGFTQDDLDGVAQPSLEPQRSGR